jgi:hypothetical protein
MNRPVTLRAVIVLTLVTGPFLALPGCGGEKPRPSQVNEKDKKGNPQGDPQNHPKDKPSVTPTSPPRKVDLDSGVGKEAAAFLKAFGEGSAKADWLSAGFVRMIGLPAELPTDKSRGFSANAAESWMKQIGGGATFGLPSGFAGADAAVLWGGFQGQGRTGDYSLRMIHEGGAWKIDYLSLTSAAFLAPAATGGGPEGEYQRFAARAVGGLLCDKSGMPKDNRALALAAGLTPTLRTKLAEPFGSDKEQGFDYNRGKLLLEADRIGSGAESYTTAQQGDAPEFRLEITKSGGAKSTQLLKLAKGSAPGQWLVESMTPQ